MNTNQLIQCGVTAVRARAGGATVLGLAAILVGACDTFLGDGDGSGDSSTLDSGTGGGSDGGTGGGSDGGTGGGSDGGTGGGSDGGTGPGPDGVTPPGDTLSDALQFNSREIASGVFAPLTAQGIKPYSYATNQLAVINSSDAPVQVTGYVIIPVGETRPEEWTITQTPVTTSGLLELEPFTLEPNDGYAFNVLYSPVQTGTNEAKLRVLFDDGQYNEITLRGRARDAAFISSQLEPVWEINWGHANTSSDILAGALAVDGEGNSYFTANVTNWIDGFNHDISVTRVNADGTVAWAQVFHEEFLQEQPDSGQNGQTGGVSRSTAMGSDGFLYVVGKRSVGDEGGPFEALVLKVDPADGTLVWARGFASAGMGMPSPGAEAYAVDATLQDRIIVTGIMAGNNQEVMLLAISKEDGSLIWHRHAGLSEPDRGYTLSIAADGTGYVGGWTAAGPAGLLMRWTGLDGDSPELEWTRIIPLPRGSLVQDIDQDDAGNAYVAFDIRGATTYLQLARINADGTEGWNAIHDQRNRGDQHTLSSITVHDGVVYAAGRFGHEGFDYTSGDGIVLALDAESGTYQWGNLYYTGTTADTVVNHRIKGLAIVDGELLVFQESRTGENNLAHYWGYWYGNPDQSVREPFGDGSSNHSLDNPLDLQTDDGFPFGVGQLDTAVLNTIEVNSVRWQPAPAAVSETPLRAMTGNAGHGTVMLSRVRINDAE